MQVVTEADLTDAGWVCGTCAQPFQAGDIACSSIEALTSNGIPIETFQCMTCWWA